MKKPEIIDENIAQEFINDSETSKSEIPDFGGVSTAAVDLTVGKEMTNEAAEILAGYVGFLNLSGLTVLTVEAAEVLSMHKGKLNLDGLTSLTDAAVESLSKHEGDLWLNGLTLLSDVAAESLSRHKAGLYFGGLTSLSDATAESLSRHIGHLHLSYDLTSLSDAAVESLSKHLNNDLSFEIENYRRIAPSVIESGEERPFYPNEGGEWTDEADFIFDGAMSNGLDIDGDSLLRIENATNYLSGTAEIHISCVENKMGQFTYIDNKEVGDIDDQFIRLFSAVAKPALIEQRQGYTELSGLDCHMSEGQAEAILKAYPEFIKKYASCQDS